MVPIQQPTTSFALASGPPPPVAPYNPQYSDPSSASMESLNRTLAAARAATQHEYHNFVDHDSITTFGGGSLLHDSANSDRAQFPSPDDSVVHFDGAQAYSFQSAFASHLYDNASHPATELQSPPQETSRDTPTLFGAYPTSSEGDVSGPQTITTFPSQLLTHFNDGLPCHSSSNNSESQSPENSSASTLAIGFHDIAESDESSTSPPAPSNPFRSPPPPMDIASRRKKVHNKPAALMADTLRSRPPMGPRTVSHAEGFRRPMDSPVSSPMRRIVSAGGNRTVSGRVYKSGVESAQRSPINLGTFAEAGAFMEQNCHTIRLPPSLTAGSSLNSSLAPPTPMSPREREMNLAKRDPSRSTASPVEGGMNYVFNAGTGCFTVEGDQNLASPPETPQAQMVLHPSNGWQTMEFSEKQWSFEVPDEPLYTPAHDTFPLELHMPQPAYLTSASQPVTPAFGKFNPNFLFGHDSVHDSGSPQYTLSTQHHEYSFPDTHQYMSPTMAKQKTFQFSHTTPADFSEK
jgi:hypothetical protein